MEGFIIFAIIVIVFISAASKAKKQQQRKVPPDQSAAPRAPLTPAQLAQLEAHRRAAVEAERRRAAGRTAAPRVQPSVSAPGAGTAAGGQGAGWHCACGKDNRSEARFCVKCGRSRADGETGLLGYYSTQGESLRGSGEGMSSEGAGLRGDTEGYSTEGRFAGAPGAAKPSLRHVVRAVTESAHAHTEGGPSEEGGALCEEEYDPHTRDSYELTGPDAYEIGQETQELPYGLSFAGSGDLARGVLLAEILAKPRALRAR